LAKKRVPVGRFEKSQIVYARLKKKSGMVIKAHKALPARVSGAPSCMAFMTTSEPKANPRFPHDESNPDTTHTVNPMA
jgi:hypothetical protein